MNERQLLARYSVARLQAAIALADGIMAQEDAMAALNEAGRQLEAQKQLPYESLNDWLDRSKAVRKAEQAGQREYAQATHAVLLAKNVYRKTINQGNQPQIENGPTQIGGVGMKKGANTEHDC